MNTIIYGGRSTVNNHEVYREISYSALTLNGKGVAWYGPCSVTFVNAAVSNRSSVFEENPNSFFDHHGLVAQRPIPPGYRAAWNRRSELAMAKLHSRIETGMSGPDFPAILMEQGMTSDDSDFIEVHTYGAIHLRAIESVKLTRKPLPGEKTIWKRLRKHLRDAFITVEKA